MDLVVYNTSWDVVGIVDVFESVLWVERYNEYSDFELVLKFDYNVYAFLQEDYYIKNPTSDKIMIIETVRIEEDPETGSRLFVSGRSLESILDRRLVLRQIIIDSTLQSGIQTILNSEIINGIFTERNIANFVFSASTDPLVTAPLLETQYYMDNVYDIISILCIDNGLGFNVHLNSSNQFVFNLYAGVNRSRDQLTNPFVVFSRKFDNLLTSHFYFSKQFMKNYVFVSGEEGLISWNQNLYGRWAQVWTPDVGPGLLRREMFLDTNYLPTTYDDSTTPIPDADYVAYLEQRGYEELAKWQEKYKFDASIDLLGVYKYKQDFFLGDLVEYEDSFGHVAKVRISEMTESLDNNSGHRLYPTLETVS